MSEQANWTQAPERSAPAIVRFMLRLSLLAGRRLTRPVLWGIAIYFWLFSPRARRASHTYLQRALGRPPRLSERLNHFVRFASCVHDRVFWLAGRHQVFEVSISGVEHVLAARDAGPGLPPRGFMFVGAHLGSFEALRALGEVHGIQTRMLMYAANAQKLNGVLAELNPDLPARIIALGQPDAMLRVRDALAAGECVGALADRNFDQQTGALLPFLGEPAEFPRGPFQLAAILRVPTVFMTGLYLGGNRYELRFAPLHDFSTSPRNERQAAVLAAQAAFVQTLEATCRSQPLNWFNFFDFWARKTPTAGSTAAAASAAMAAPASGAAVASAALQASAPVHESGAAPAGLPSHGKADGETKAAHLSQHGKAACQAQPVDLPASDNPRTATD